MARCAQGQRVIPQRSLSGDRNVLLRASRVPGVNQAMNHVPKGAERACRSTCSCPTRQNAGAGRVEDEQHAVRR